MSEPKRYTGKVEGLLLGSPHWEHPEGEWVKWEEYACLKAEVERLTAVIESHKDAGLRILSMLDEEKRLTKHLKTEVEHLMVFCNCTLIPSKELQAKVERLTKAGDMTAGRLERFCKDWGFSDEETKDQVEEWNAAKDGKQS
jgi:hypothetical protein